MAQDVNQWPLIDPLPSYGRGRDKPGGRYSSLIGGSNLTDVVITGIYPDKPYFHDSVTNQCKALPNHARKQTLPYHFQLYLYKTVPLVTGIY